MNRNTKIQTLSVRFSAHLYDRICKEAEQLNITNAEALRVIAQNYFSAQDEGVRLDALEAAILNAVKESEQSLRRDINALVAA